MFRVVSGARELTTIREPQIRVSSWGIGGARGLDRSGGAVGNGTSLTNPSNRLYGRAGRFTVADPVFDARVKPMKTRRSELASVGALKRKKSA